MDCSKNIAGQSILGVCNKPATSALGPDMPGRRSISDFFAFGTESLPSKWSAAETRRQHFPQSGLLIDRLVEFAGLQLSYPPRNISDLQHWLSELSQADLDLSDLQKHAFRLYLLCDFNPESADAYALNFFLPRNYLFAIKGYWALDQGEHPLAVSALARPGVDVDPPVCF